MKIGVNRGSFVEEDVLTNVGRECSFSERRSKTKGAGGHHGGIWDELGLIGSEWSAGNWNGV